MVPSPSNTHLVGLFLLAGFSITLAADVLIPPPKGPYSTLISTTKLTDTTRLDPFAPTNTSRSLMLSIYTPTPPSQCSTNLTSIDYMPPQTSTFYDEMYASIGIPSGTFSSLKLQVCSPRHKNYPPQQYPILLFSPGLGNSRLEYHTIAQSLSSNGYIVISIDHPYDACIVEYPDGSTILATDISTDSQITFALSVRTQDINFIINQLTTTPPSPSPPTTQTPLPFPFPNPNCRSNSNTKQIGIFGHSLGGATALSSLLNNTHLTSGLNLDGTLFGPALLTTTTKPFLLLGHQGKNQTTDPSWATTWPNLQGWKLELEVLGAQHASFTDLPILVDVLGLRPYLPDAVIALLGKIAGERGLEIVRVYVGAFFDAFLKGKGSGVLREGMREYPEVVIVDKGGEIIN